MHKNYNESGGSNCKNKNIAGWECNGNIAHSNNHRADFLDQLGCESHILCFWEIADWFHTLESTLLTLNID